MAHLCADILEMVEIDPQHVSLSSHLLQRVLFSTQKKSSASMILGPQGSSRIQNNEGANFVSTSCPSSSSFHEQIPNHITAIPKHWRSVAIRWTPNL